MIVILIGIFTLIPGCQQAKTSSFSQASGIESEKIDTIAVQADWGESKTFTAKSDIDKILHYFDSYRYTQDESQDIYFGSTTFSFYSGGSLKARVYLGIYPIINDKKYRTDKEMDNSIGKVTGLTPPSS